MNNRRQIKFLLALLTLTLLIGGLKYLINLKQDPDIGYIDTKGWLAAIEHSKLGSRIIILKPDGKKLLSPGFKKGVIDQQLVWRPDGQRLFFLSNRNSRLTQIYRWNLSHNIIEQRTFNNRAKSKIDFGPPLYSNANKSAIFVSGGEVLEFDPSNGSTRQLLPPISGNPDYIAQSLIIYQNLGTNFIKALWGKNREKIFATIRNSAGGETLIEQDTHTHKLPEVLAQSKSINFIVDKMGNIKFKNCTSIRSYIKKFDIKFMNNKLKIDQQKDNSLNYYSELTYSSHLKTY